MQKISQEQTLKNILFVDIETVSCTNSYQTLSSTMKMLWDKKVATAYKNADETASKLFFDKAAIYAEFGKIIVIGLGFMTFDAHGAPTLRVKALRNHDEKQLLQDFVDLLTTGFEQQRLRLCGHNGKEFDFPYLCRRMTVHGIPLPPVLDTAGKKPWEVMHIDTMEMWKFGDKKSFASLQLMATLFGIGHSKTLMDGSEVNDYYYNQNALDRIATYCMHDVVVTAQVFFKLNLWEPLKPAQIILA